VDDLVGSVCALLDPVATAILVPLAWWILLNGIDDFVIDLIGLQSAFRRRTRISKCERREAANAPQKRIAILVPCWHEHAVIGRMIRQNLGAVTYNNYDFFIGVYPNDEPTLDVVEELAAKNPKVHVAICPHDGPTSKPDCLNSAWETVLGFERAYGKRFEVVVTHDAEDFIHPQSLHWINYLADSYGMVQIPVLPLPTPLSAWTHGVYCDEFVEYQTRDMPARNTMGAFVPSNGVGTGFRRDVLEMLGQREGHLFEPSCLTEDYENGYRLGLHSIPQVFLPLHTEGIATREMFPSRFKQAIVQRTRWVMGIALQTWERHGWKGTLTTKYWLWRDRKGLINSPSSLAANLLWGYAVAGWSISHALGREWELGVHLSAYPALLSATTILFIHRGVYRILCVSHVYGWKFAIGSPTRMVYANLINSVAAFNAIRKFTLAKIRRQRLTWAKTTHEYPVQVSFATDGRRLGELMVARGVLSAKQLAGALATQPTGQRLGEHLIRTGTAGEMDVYESLCLQQGLPMANLDPADIPRSTARALPGSIVHKYRVLPFRIEFASMFLAATDLPTKELRDRLRRYTMMDVRFHLVTPSNFNELVTALL
jgi:bacteriophage N4 adsorption protein B